MLQLPVLVFQLLESFRLAAVHPAVRRLPAVVSLLDDPCCRHNSAVVNPASPCFRIAMICSSLCRVPFMAVLLSWVWENSHSRRSSFRGLRQNVTPRWPEAPNSQSEKLLVYLVS